MIAAKRVVASLLLANFAYGFSFGPDMLQKMLKIQSMQTQFGKDSLETDQQQALMRYAGFDDMELFYSKQIDASDLKRSLKQQMKDRMIENMVSSGGIDISSPLFRKMIVGDTGDGEILSSMDQFRAEPMKTIVRLMKNSNAAYAAKGKELLKKFQYRQFNTDGGSVITQNWDKILGSDKPSSTYKDLLKQDFTNKMFKDPIDRAIYHYMQQKKSSSDAALIKELDENIKDLQKIRIFKSYVPPGSPVTEDNLYAFYRMVKGQVNSADVLNVALGQELGPISHQEFERYFGSPAKQFSCRAHKDTLRVPCGIELEPEECERNGCCYDAGSAANVPKCYQNLYGRIGSALLRKEYIESTGTETTSKAKWISNLFVGDKIPHLSNILRDETPYGVDIDPHATNTAYDMPYQSNFKKNWWDSVLVKGDADSNSGIDVSGTRYAIGGDEFNQQWDGMNGGGQRLAYGNPGGQQGSWDKSGNWVRAGGNGWKAYGDVGLSGARARGTASPYIGEHPGVNPTAGPNGDGTMDQYYQMWLEYAAVQDEAQCALIPKNARVRCMENDDAWMDWVDAEAKTLKQKESKCYKAGCCFSELAFLKEKKEDVSMACYRAIDYGTCNVATDFDRRECGAPGITQEQCISDIRCCYKPSTKQGEPWCFYKNSATLREDEWCEAYQWEEYVNKVREPCFKFAKNNMFKTHNDDTDNVGFTNINNLVNRDVCENAECCYDDSLTTDITEWLVEGLGQAENQLFRCFQKINPTTADNKLINFNKKPDGTTDLDSYNGMQWTRTCDATQWDPKYADPTFGKRSCGSNLSYYQCVYVNRCCYKPTVTNEPACYHPEKKKP